MDELTAYLADEQAFYQWIITVRLEYLFGVDGVDLVGYTGPQWREVFWAETRLILRCLWNGTPATFEYRGKCWFEPAGHQRGRYGRYIRLRQDLTTTYAFEIRAVSASPQG